jgi:hypothetical protein
MVEDDEREEDEEREGGRVWRRREGKRQAPTSLNVPLLTDVRSNLRTPVSKLAAYAYSPLINLIDKIRSEVSLHIPSNGGGVEGVDGEGEGLTNYGQYSSAQTGMYPRASVRLIA